MVGGAAGVVVWQRQVTEPRTVVVAARDLSRGHVVSADDLRPATLMGAQGVKVIPTAQAASLVGGVLTVDVAASSLMSTDVVEHRPLPTPGEALVSVALRPGEAPPDVAALDQVDVITVRLDPLGTAPPDIAVHRGEVWAVQPPTDLDPTMVVTLRTADEVLERVTLADRVRLGVIAP